MKFGFIGCGAIGSCYASKLIPHHEVCVLDTFQPVIDEIKKNGILVDCVAPGDGDGQTHAFHPAIATTDPKEIGVCDIVIVFVHYQFLEAAVRNALPMFDEHTVIMCLQNGYGNYDEIAKVIPEEQIVIGNTAFGATPIAPGHVAHTGTGVTTMGTIKAPLEKAQMCADALAEAGLEVSVRENVMNAIWFKLCANVAINAQSALLETKNGLINENEYLHRNSIVLIQEALAVAKTIGCTLQLDDVLNHAFDVSKKTDETISSMVQDVRKHKETEIEIINGAVIKLGREHGVPTPANEFVYNLLKAKQSLYLGR